MGTLYLVATPLGNLEDISARALRILSQVKLIAAEDTRHTRKLLEYFKIQTPLTAYHEHNKLIKLDKVLKILTEGDVALVSDAGTPALNDPGYELVRAVLEVGHNVSPIPGPAAPIAALVASGLPTDKFVYLGYIPRRASERRKFLIDTSHLPYTLIFLETPHRLLESLQYLLDILGDRQICVAREITKMYEEFFRGKISEALEYFSSRPVRGEFTLVIDRQRYNAEPWDEERLWLAIDKQVKSGLPAKEIATRLATEANWPRRKIYQMIVNQKESFLDES